MLTMRLLGPVEIRIDQRVLPAAGRDKGLCLLSYLAATADRRHTRETLADLFWPEMSRERGLQNLRQNLLRLRQLLDDSHRERPHLLADKHSIGFNPDSEHWLDLAEFDALHPDRDGTDHLQRGATLYRDGFMADHPGGFGERFDDWLRARRDACRVQCMAIEAALAERLERSGRAGAAVAHARRCTELDPWEEICQQRLVRVLALCGQREAALQHFVHWQALVRDELGIDPSPGFLSLIESIRASPAEDSPKPMTGPSERRHVTVLDCGLAWKPEQDPELVAEALAIPLQQARATIERRGGHVFAHSPGRLTACFGWPDPDERASSHAADAALAILAQFQREHPEVSPGIGLASGPMLVQQDMGGSWLIAEHALRARTAAGAGQAMVTADVATLLAARFELQEMPSSDPASSRHWRLLEHERAPAPRTGPLPLLGRDAELSQLWQAWERVRGGASSSVQIIGPAGIGKSRLARELLRWAQADGARVLHCECDPLHTNSPLSPLRDLLREGLELAAPALPRQQEAALRRLATWLRDECALEAAPRDKASGTPVVAAARLLARVLAQVESGAILVLEDAHWADNGSLEVLAALLQQRLPRLLVLLVSRESLALPDSDCLQLTALDAPAARELAHLAAAPASPDDELVRIAEGIPLFIVELARMHGQGHASGAPLPLRLRELLTARLAQAGPDQLVLQAAAVIGRNFSRAAASELSQQQGAALDHALQRLAAAGLLEHIGTGLRFAHVLLQRAAYDTLPRERRLSLHRHYARWLRAGGEGTTGLQAEQLAWHLSAGGLEAEAAPWWLRAARHASHLPAYEEAVRFAERALSCIELAPQRDSMHEMALSALLLAAHARIALGGYFDPAAQSYHARAHSLVQTHRADPRQMLAMLRGHWLGASSRSSHREAHAIATEMTALAQEVRLPALEGVARYLLGNSALWLGAFTEALAQLERAVDLLGRHPVATDGLLDHEQDFEATATGYLGWAHWHLGDGERALQLGRTALERARRHGHLPTLLHVGTSFCSIALGSEAAEEALAVATQGLELARAHELSMWADIALLQQSLAHCASGRGADTRELADALQRLRQTYPGGCAGFELIAAHVHLAVGELEPATALLRALRRSVRSTQAGIFLVPRWLLESEIARRHGQRDRARAAARRALRFAEQQQAKRLVMDAQRALSALV